MLLVVLAISDKLLAQEQDFLQAKVLDQKTGEPVIFFRTACWKSKRRH